jgi:hypothetical protein
MPLETQLEAVARAEDVQNLLDHIAWTDTILPALLKHRAAYEAQLVNCVLGQRTVLLNGQVLTPEQLAGRIDGMTYTIRVFEDVLRAGERALQSLKNVGFVSQ